MTQVLTAKAAALSALADLLLLLASFPAVCVSQCSHPNPACLTPGCTSLFGYSTPITGRAWLLLVGAYLVALPVAAALLVTRRTSR